MQVIPKESKGTNQVLKKHVAAIHIGAKLSFLQRKLVNALLYHAYDELLTAQEHSIDASVLCEMIGFDSKNTSYLKAALKGLMETVVEFDVLEENGEQVWEAMTLLPYARLKNGVCTYRIERSLAEKLYHPDVYSKINLSVLRELTSGYALVLYENCFRYVDIGHTAWWDVDVFRKLMAVDMMSSYKPFKVLNRNVIQPAIKEVNKLSNIQVEMETRFKGRTVTGLRFLVKPNLQLSLMGMEAEDEVSTSPAYLELLKAGISKTLARQWVIEHGETYIFDKLDLVHNQAARGRIRSTKSGFLRAAIEGDYRNEGTAKKKLLAATEEAKREKANLEGRLGRLKDAHREAENLYRRECVKTIEDAVQALSEAQREAVTDEFRQGISNRFCANSFRRIGWSDRTTHLDAVRFWKARGLTFPSPVEVAQRNKSQEPSVLKAQIEELEEKLGLADES